MYHLKVPFLHSGYSVTWECSHSVSSYDEIYATEISTNTKCLLIKYTFVFHSFEECFGKLINYINISYSKYLIYYVGEIWVEWEI